MIDRTEVNAGVYSEIAPTGLRVFSGPADVTHNYEIIYNSAALTITPCPVSVSGIKIPDKEYDGTTAVNNFDLSELTFVTEGSDELFINEETGERDELALDPEKISATLSSNNARVSQAATLTILNTALADVEGKDVARNYILIPDESQTSAFVNIVKRCNMLCAVED